jgi:hypothetical protein
MMTLMLSSSSQQQKKLKRGKCYLSLRSLWLSSFVVLNISKKKRREQEFTFSFGVAPLARDGEKLSG